MVKSKKRLRLDTVLYCSKPLSRASTRSSSRRVSAMLVSTSQPTRQCSQPVCNSRPKSFLLPALRQEWERKMWRLSSVRMGVSEAYQLL